MHQNHDLAYLRKTIYVGLTGSEYHHVTTILQTACTWCIRGPYNM